MEREPLRFVNGMERSPLQYLSKTFTRSSKVTLPNIRKGLVKVTFQSHLQYLNGSLSKSLRSLKVYFCAVEVTVQDVRQCTLPEVKYQLSSLPFVYNIETKDDAVPVIKQPEVFQ